MTKWNLTHPCGSHHPSPSLSDLLFPFGAAIVKVSLSCSSVFFHFCELILYFIEAILRVIVLLFPPLCIGLIKSHFLLSFALFCRRSNSLFQFVMADYSRRPHRGKCPVCPSNNYRDKCHSCHKCDICSWWTKKVWAGIVERSTENGAPFPKHRHGHHYSPRWAMHAATKVLTCRHLACLAVAFMGFLRCHPRR